jgi:putative Mg2+ transporter-C (MgtC) family protein
MWQQLSAIDIHWLTVWWHLILLGVAYLLALPIAWNRERFSRSAGLRTYPLVAVATCGFMLVGIEVLGSTDAEGRVMQGIVTGMGFIGGGAILKNGNHVIGMATAASLWSTGALGLAVAWQRFEIALVLSLVTFLTLQFVPSLKPLVSADEKSDELE